MTVWQERMKQYAPSCKLLSDGKSTPQAPPRMKLSTTSDAFWKSKDSFATCPMVRLSSFGSPSRQPFSPHPPRISHDTKWQKEQ